MTTTLKAIVRKPRTDGLYAVYIRIVHNRKPGYIKTNKIVDADHISKENEPTDPVVNEYCSMLVRQYTDRLNRTNTSLWSVSEIIEYLLKTDEEVCFSEYARMFIRQMRADGHERNAKNYQLAVAYLERYMGTTRVMFGHLTAAVLKKWIESLSKTHRAKEMYPINVRMIFRSAIADMNDDEKGIQRIKFDPWVKVQISKSEPSEKLAISAEECREFFNRPLPRTKMLSSLPELGRDVALLSLCLGGINTVDLYNLKKSDYRDGIIGYKRAKTKHSHHVKVIGGRLAIHENRKLEKEIRKVSIIEFDEIWFNGKNIVTFDDVITRGITWATYSDQLENLGAHVLSGIFLAKTHYKVKTN